jgi:hypothetical protein
MELTCRRRPCGLRACCSPSDPRPAHRGRRPRTPLPSPARSPTARPLPRTPQAPRPPLVPPPSPPPKTGILRCTLGNLRGRILTTGYRALPPAVAGTWGRITWTARCRRSSASSRTSRLCAPPALRRRCRAALRRDRSGAALTRCGGAQVLWREQAQRHDRRLDRLAGEAHLAVSAPLRPPGHCGVL